MTNIERVIWTVLPKGFDPEGRLVVSVHVAPRLTTDPETTDEQTLDAFDAFSDWPKRLADISFAVDIDGTKYPAKPITKASSTLWANVFPPTKTGVRPHRSSCPDWARELPILAADAEPHGCGVASSTRTVRGS